MIVQPGFLDHWKTRRLVDLTGDASAPMAVIRLWAFCQESRKWEFPAMTPTQLASVCHWENRKPACHVALAKAGFLDKLAKGYGVHAWHEHNSRLIHNWAAGEKGGRPAKDTKPNETGQNDKTLGEPEANPKRTLLRPDQTRPDGEDWKDTPLRPPASPDGPPRGVVGVPEGAGVPVSELGGGVGAVKQLVAGIVKPPVEPPTVEQVRNALAAKKPLLAQFAEDVHGLYVDQKGRDGDGKLIGDWIRWALGVANGLLKKRRV